MEILSPAGSYESIVAAVQNGADSVYFGGRNFNARRNASNIGDDILKQAIDYCKLRGVKSYITLNTLLFDKELNGALNFAKMVYEMGADAVIVQDMGLIRALRSTLPDLSIHASTQLGIHDIEGARLMEALGVSRIVLARELSLNTIRAIHKSVDIELEAFAHGAMCVSFSGQCLFSSMIGERSGNRGTCAQPCRKHISVNGMNKSSERYDLSLADMCMIEHLDAMREAGISCIKLEGRMKRSEYVAAVTRAYRAAADGADRSVIDEYKRIMTSVFERGGFCTGNYFKDDRRTGCVAVSAADNDTYAMLRRTYDGEYKLISADFVLTLKKEKNAQLCMIACLNGKRVEALAEGSAVQKAEKEQDAGRLEEQIRKLGDTAFNCRSCRVDMEPDAFISISAVNELRRKVCRIAEAKLLDATTKKIADKIQLPEVVRIRYDTARDAKQTLICASVSNEIQANAAFLAGADEVALRPYDYSLATSALERLQQYRGQKRLLIELPHVILSRSEHTTIERLLKEELTDGAVINNPGQLELVRDQKLRIGGIGLNVLNSHTASMLYELGLERITLSLELTRAQMRDILKTVGGGIWVYGRAPLMQLTHCAAKEHGGCRDCHGDAGCFIDEEGRVFPLMNTRQGADCLIQMLNCRITDIRDIYAELPTPDSVLLSFSNEAGDEIADVIGGLMGEKIIVKGDITRGHYNRSVE